MVSASCFGAPGLAGIARRHRSGFSTRGEIAQLVEQRTENPRVVGSIPTLATHHIFLQYNLLQRFLCPLFCPRKTVKWLLRWLPRSPNGVHSGVAGEVFCGNPHFAGGVRRPAWRAGHGENAGRLTAIASHENSMKVPISTIWLRRLIGYSVFTALGVGRSGRGNLGHFAFTPATALVCWFQTAVGRPPNVVPHPLVLFRL